MELDADLGEALWVLQRPPGRFDLRALTQDTRASLARVAGARAAFLATLDKPTRLVVEGRAVLLRRTLVPEDAYRDLPGTR